MLGNTDQDVRSAHYAQIAGECGQEDLRRYVVFLPPDVAGMHWLDLVGVDPIADHRNPAAEIRRPAAQPARAPDSAAVSSCLALAQPPSPTRWHEPSLASGKRAADVDVVPVLWPVVAAWRRQHARRLPLGRVHRG